jgi:hypothetical protein
MSNDTLTADNKSMTSPPQGGRRRAPHAAMKKPRQPGGAAGECTRCRTQGVDMREDAARIALSSVKTRRVSARLATLQAAGLFRPRAAACEPHRSRAWIAPSARKRHSWPRYCAKSGRSPQTPVCRRERRVSRAALGKGSAFQAGRNVLCQLLEHKMTISGPGTRVCSNGDSVPSIGVIHP